MNTLSPVAIATLLALQLPLGHAQDAPAPAADDKTLKTVTINASADASAQGLSPRYAGGQVARGGRAGILGTRDNLETPFSITAYTNELIQDRQARSVGEVLQNDPSVRVARGFGNFQESYYIRGFIQSSDDVAYNGLYSLLPRQYIATELFERVEVLRGASAFLSGANPSGNGLGGSINLLPKRAPNEPLSRVTVAAGSGGQGTVSADIARRFDPDNATGIRVNAAYRDGGTAVDNERNKLGLLAVGADWRSRDVRLSGDIGFQDNRLKQTRTNVTLSGLTAVPAAPDASKNYAQPWSFSNERDLFGTARAEWDITPDLTAYAAYGMRRGEEANSLANLSVNNASGAGTTYRFDNQRKDRIDTGELGLRGKLKTGAVKHEWVVVGSMFNGERDNAYIFDFGNQQATNLYNPVLSPLPAFSAAAGSGNRDNPQLTGKVKLTSFAIGDTLSLFDDTVLVTLGARRQTLNIEGRSYRTMTGSTVTGPGNVVTSYEKSRTSPLAAIVYRPNKQLSLYANYVEGLSQGETAPATASGQPVTNVGTQLSPYVTKQKEVGVKYDGGRFGGSVALFSTTKPRSLIDNRVFTSGGEDEHQGVELNVQGEPTRGVRVLGGVTWLNAKQKSTGVATTEGKYVIGVPKVQASFGTEFDIPGMPGLALDARVVHTGASYYDAANLLRVPGWTRLDGGVRYLTDIGGHLVTLRLRVDNLTDRNYWASSGGNPGSSYLVVGGPRSVNLSASVDF